mgnify:CR=1 FL=1
MKYPHEDNSPKEAGYRLARYGALGAYILPVLDSLLDRAKWKSTKKLATLAAGLLFVAFIVTGKINTSHRKAILAEERYSQEPTETYAYKYAVGHYKNTLRGRRWVGESYNMYVTRNDAAFHRLWKLLRQLSGWALLITLTAIGIVWWRSHQRELAAGAFGEGTPEYEAFLARRSPEAAHQRQMRNDWLVSGVPEPGERAFREGGDRPKFGRKKVDED